VGIAGYCDTLAECQLQEGTPDPGRGRHGAVEHWCREKQKRRPWGQPRTIRLVSRVSGFIIMRDENIRLFAATETHTFGVLVLHKLPASSYFTIHCQALTEKKLNNH